MVDNNNPYKSMNKNSFWSTAFTKMIKKRGGDDNFFDIKSLIELFDKKAIVSSAGSCFAQHIGKNLLNHGYSFKVSSFETDRCGSFGLGNIYTIRQFKQWLEFVADCREWSEQTYYVDKEGHYYDYLIPQLPSMNSLEDIIKRRNLIKDEIKEVLTSSDIFIFTLGLTEAWINSNNEVFPMCPGTLVGVFDKDEHLFHNFDYMEVLEDLNKVKEYLKIFNPKLMMIFTVSPVPLTATASENHILLANNYSKSVLRAATGKFCDMNKDAHYFASYELITHQLAEDWRFLGNCRTVAEDGVDYVMNHAFKTQNDRLEKTKSTSYEEEICDEELLNAYANLNKKLEKKSNLFLIGDSHVGRLSTAFNKVNIGHIGGMVMNGSGFSDKKFNLDKESIFEPTESRESLEIWNDIFKNLKEMDAKENKIITNIGFQTHRTIAAIINSTKVENITIALVAEYFCSNFTEHIEILHRLTKFGKVYLLEDPNFWMFCADKNRQDRCFTTYTEYMKLLATELGITYISTTNIIELLLIEKVTLEQMIDNDGMHGTNKFYDAQAKYIANLINL